MAFFEGGAGDLVQIGPREGERHVPKGALPGVRPRRGQPVSELDTDRVIVGRRTRRGVVLHLDPGPHGDRMAVECREGQTCHQRDDSGHR